jgi:hypothetical protein
MLPDLAAQIQEYIDLPINSQPKATIFVICFGFWDIYHFASLDFKLSQNITERTITEMFAQLDILYANYAKDIARPYIEPDSPSNANNTTTIARTFRLVIPKLFDPTLLPGWISQRPVPLQPSSVAEEQKNAVYLTRHWNELLEHKLDEWLQATPEVEDDETTKLWGKFDPEAIQLRKDVFFYDLPSYLVDVILEQQLEEDGLSDAAGHGNGDSPFENVKQGCVGFGDGMIEANGMGVCKEPDDYLFWTGFSLGSVANEAVGKAVGEMVKEGMTEAKKDGSGKSGWFGK